MNKTFIFDIDGTFFTSKGTILPQTLESLKNAIKTKGFTFILASGRPLSSLVEIAESLEFKPTYLVGSNGGVVMDWKEQRIIYKSKISKDFIQILMSQSEMENKKIVFQRIEVSSTYNLEQKDIDKLEDFSFGKLENIDSEQIKLIDDCSMIAIDIDATPLKPEVEKTIHYLADKHGYSTIIMPQGYLDIFPKKVSKGYALQHLETQGILDATISYSFGDGLNDVEMHRWAKYSYAMEQALPEVKASAKETIGNNDSGAISKTIDKIINSL